MSDALSDMEDGAPSIRRRSGRTPTELLTAATAPDVELTTSKRTDPLIALMEKWQHRELVAGQYSIECPTSEESEHAAVARTLREIHQVGVGGSRDTQP